MSRPADGRGLLSSRRSASSIWRGLSPLAAVGGPVARSPVRLGLRSSGSSWETMKLDRRRAPADRSSVRVSRGCRVRRGSPGNQTCGPHAGIWALLGFRKEHVTTIDGGEPAVYTGTPDMKAQHITLALEGADPRGRPGRAADEPASLGLQPPRVPPRWLSGGGFRPVDVGLKVDEACAGQRLAYARFSCVDGGRDVFAVSVTRHADLAGDQ